MRTGGRPLPIASSSVHRSATHIYVLSTFSAFLIAACAVFYSSDDMMIWRWCPPVFISAGVMGGFLIAALISWIAEVKAGASSEQPRQVPTTMVGHIEQHPPQLSVDLSRFVELDGIDDLIDQQIGPIRDSLDLRIRILDEKLVALQSTLCSTESGVPESVEPEVPFVSELLTRADKLKRRLDQMLANHSQALDARDVGLLELIYDLVTRAHEPRLDLIEGARKLLSEIETKLALAPAHQYLEVRTKLATLGDDLLRASKALSTQAISAQEFERRLDSFQDKVNNTRLPEMPVHSDDFRAHMERLRDRLVDEISAQYVEARHSDSSSQEALGVLGQAMNRLGLEMIQIIPGVTRLDTRFHEVCGSVSGSGAPGTVARVIEMGYKDSSSNVVIRKAKVYTTDR